MVIDLEGTIEKLARLGVIVDRSLGRDRLALAVENLVHERRITPVYGYGTVSAPPPARDSKSARTADASHSRNGVKDPVSRRIEEEMSTYELRSRFRFDFAAGAIYERETGRRVDILHYFRQYETHNVRYRQVSLRVRHLQGKLAAHRMLWAAFHNRWPRPGWVVDHRSGDTLENHICNLEEVTHAENIRRGFARERPSPAHLPFCPGCAPRWA